MVRETIFNLIGQDVAGRVVLDLFAGTGGLGVEALSRGASWVLFIDNFQQAVTLIKKNLVLCRFETMGIVLKRDLRSGLPWKHVLMKEKKFDLVFIDPPYGKGLIPSILKDLSEKRVLAPNADIVVESSVADKLPDSLGSIRRLNRKSYGKTKLTIYKCGDEI
jgi:16S rRNA (guanine(966)-N(2))-methyltransferase RsmD